MDPLDQPFRLIKTNRGADKLIEGGFVYTKNRRAGEVTHWRCEQRGECKARIHTEGTEIVKRISDHLHAPDNAGVSCCEVKIGVKRRAQESQDSAHHIASESVQTVSDSTIVKLPKLDSLKRTIRRERVNVLAAPVQPTSLTQLALPADYQQTAKGEQFILYDSGATDPQRFLIFGTQRNLEMLQASHYWMADGTFKTAPSLFAQVYVVHGLRGEAADLTKTGHLLPSIFVLLPNKTEATYRRMWEQIRILCPAAQPVHMLLDFEKAAINSFTHVWPNALVKCCFFHLTQNIWRKVQTVGLQADYIHSEELALAIRKIPALAFAPPDSIPDLFAQVAQELPPTSQIAELLDYFQSTYIGRTSLGGYYQTATFPIDLWNYHYDTPLGLPRTTNAVEAWHRSFNATVGCHHPSIWKFISALKREQGLVEVRQARFIAGNSPTKRKKSLQSEKSLTKLVGRLYTPGYDEMDFLKGVAHHFSLGAH